MIPQPAIQIIAAVYMAPLTWIMMLHLVIENTKGHLATYKPPRFF